MKTTLNIRTYILRQISLAAKAESISCSAMIAILLKKAMKGIGSPDCMGRLVQYQEPCRPEEQHTFHITWKEYDYEYFQDMRKLQKMSVSLLLARAVKRYLGKKNTINKSDNYLFINYTIIKEVIDNIICWRFIWGYTPTLIKRL